MAGQTYRERPPVRRLAALVTTTWVQRIPRGEPAYPQRHLPTGGVELRCRVGYAPQLAGVLTGPHVELLLPGTTVVGLRLRPGALAAVLGRPVADLTGLVVDAVEVWGTAAAAAGERLAAATTDDAAVGVLEDLVAAAALRTGATGPEPLLAEATRRLMPWHAAEVRAVGAELYVSERGFRRHCLAGVGIGPKALQRILRFQGFLARTQAATAAGGEAAGDGLARLAVDAGYADQAHLTRECVRLAGVTPRVFLRGVGEACACGHDHSASYTPLLREAQLAGSFKNGARGAPSLAS
ncbi:AraC family transcriptional regulator [Jiangella aurantiaca]|uniref:AraC family transcriptional regulator n=1 Tax=Jiangella aurantiaca TaxID=2530373 RepID=A0A4R4ZZH8_9ACTN|nr:AraC family transcriptional regulator [Jiangella aurantiaca]TDD64878.1 AraC family transcriptional regulator [Jiangella aurantiaca]